MADVEPSIVALGRRLAGKLSDENWHSIESLLLSAEKEDAFLRAQLAERDAEIERLKEELKKGDE